MTFWREPDYPTGNGPILLLPAERFVARHVPLTEGMDVTEQVELAVEACSPLPLAQLYWGYRLAADRRSALVWIASRKLFGAEEVATWAKAAAVLPASLALCDPPTTRPVVLLRREPDRAEVAAWTATSSCPVVLLARRNRGDNDSTAGELVEEARRRSGLDAAQVVERGGGIMARATASPAGLALHCGNLEGIWRWTELATADLRPRADLARAGRSAKRERRLWHASTAALVAVLAAALADLGTAAAAAWLKHRQGQLAARTSAVAEVQSSHALAHRLGELSQQRLRFMEMLDVLNEKRPAGLLFVRVLSAGPRAMEIKARSARADDARLYESALRSTPALRLVRMADLQTRDGQTELSLHAEFQPDTGRETP